jgi:hypothetical protein
MKAKKHYTQKYKKGKWGDEKKIRSDFDDGKIDRHWHSACLKIHDNKKKRIKKGKWAEKVISVQGVRSESGINRIVKKVVR